MYSKPPPSPLNIAILTGQWGKSGPLLLWSTKSQLEQQKWTTLVQAKCKHIPDELWRWQETKCPLFSKIPGKNSDHN